MPQKTLGPEAENCWPCSKKKPTESLRKPINSWRGISNAKNPSCSQTLSSKRSIDSRGTTRHCWKFHRRFFHRCSDLPRAGVVQALPGIVGTPLFYKHELNAELIYDLCAALVRAGIARPEDWEPCRADALSFAKPPAMKAIGAERGELLRRNVEFQMEIAMHIRSGTCTTETQDSAVVHSLFLSLVLAPVFFDLGKSSMHWSGKRKGWNRCAHSPGRSASTSTRSRCPGPMRAFDCCRRTSTSS